MGQAPAILVIGLDGATFRVLDPLLAAGVMPTLARLRQEGTAGTLASVIPTNSMAAWGTFMTGKNPGKHGVYEFRMPVDGDLRRKEIATSRSLRALSLWRLLAPQGKRLGVINVPLTYPPDPVDGFMVSGIIVPSGRTFTHPPELTRALQERWSNYRVAIPWRPYEGKVEKFLHDLHLYTEARAEATLWLAGQTPVDLLMVVFTETDRLQHALWQYIDPTHPAYDPGRAAAYRPAIEAYFRALDNAVARVLTLAGPETTVLALSDHGFQSNAIQFSLNDWLADLGYLTRTAPSGGQRLIQGMKRRNLQYRNWIHRLRRWYRISAPASWKRPMDEGLDWAHTRACCVWAHQEGIRLNVRGREETGIVAPGAEYDRLREELRRGLLALRNPVTGDRVVERVLYREEYYSGPHMEEAPDLVLLPGPHIRVAPAPHPGSNFKPTGWASGGHHMDGIVIAAGKHVRRGARVEGARLMDLAPTILYLLDQPVPNDMDGVVLEGLLDPALLAARAPRVGPSSQIGPDSPGQVYTDEEMEDVKEQLRSLGYLG